MRAASISLLFLTSGFCVAFTLGVRVLPPAQKAQETSLLPALIRYWERGTLQIDWATVRADKLHGLVFISHDPGKKMAQLSSFAANSPKLIRGFKLGAALHADTSLGALHVLTTDSASPRPHWQLWSRYQPTESAKPVHKWRTLQLTDDYGAYFFDEYGQLPCLDAAGRRYYASTDTTQAAQPVEAGSGWQIRQLHQANKAGLALVSVSRDAPPDAPIRYLVYSCQRHQFITDPAVPFRQAFFLTDRLLKVQAEADTTWHFMAADPGRPQPALGPFRTIIARGEPAPAIEPTAPGVPKPLAAAQRWHYAAIDTARQLHLYDSELAEYQSPADGSPLPSSPVDKLWWLPGGQGFIVHVVEGSQAGWLKWEYGKPPGKPDGAYNMRPLVKDWFLCQATKGSMRCQIRRFNKKATSEEELRLANLDAACITHGQWPPGPSKEIVHVAWRDGPNTWPVSYNRAATYLADAKECPQQRLTQGTRLFPLGRLLVVLDDSAAHDNDHRWWLYDYRSKQQKPSYRYYLLNPLPLTLPGDETGRYFLAQREASQPRTRRLIRYEPGQALSPHLSQP